MDDQINFLNKYHVLDFNNTSFSNVSINYERFRFDQIIYINIYQYQNESKYFLRLMKWRGLPGTSNNGSNVRSDFTDIKKEIFDLIMGMYRTSGEVGVVSSIKDDFVYLKLWNLKVKKI